MQPALLLVGYTRARAIIAQGIKEANLEEKDLRTRLQEIAEELRAMAANGLHFGHDEYDIARYQQVMRLAAELFSLTDSRSADEVYALYSGHIDVYTPKV